MTLHTFEELGISKPLVERLIAGGITTPSPVQAEAIPAVLSGRDVLAQSQTGTGKTLVYLLPILQRLDPARKTTQALILAPTQELAMQIMREAQRYAEGMDIEIQALIGGAAIGRQVERLKKRPQLVVGTPGRVRELLAMRKLKLHETGTLVIDEVDQLFQLGGAEEARQILHASLRDRQLLFLSATVTPEIRELALNEMKDMVEVGIEPEQRTSASIEHLYFVCDRDKIDYVRRIIRTYEAPKVLVFINQTDAIAEVEAKLNYVGLNAGAIYGDADKITRSLTLRRFREGEYRVLVASDVAARGLDIEKLDLVIHLDPAIDADHYVHRAGRTGRMGRPGKSITIVNPRETFIIRKFARELGITFGLRGLAGGRITTPRTEQQESSKGNLRSGEGARRSEAVKGRESAGGFSRGQARTSDAESTPAGSRPSRSGGGAPQKQSGSGKDASAPGERKLDRHRDRKNKGAPKWLKNKPPRD